MQTGQLLCDVSWIHLWGLSRGRHRPHVSQWWKLSRPPTLNYKIWSGHVLGTYYTCKTWLCCDTWQTQTTRVRELILVTSSYSPMFVNVRSSPVTRHSWEFTAYHHPTQLTQMSHTHSQSCSLAPASNKFIDSIGIPYQNTYKYSELSTCHEQSWLVYQLLITFQLNLH